MNHLLVYIRALVFFLWSAFLYIAWSSPAEAAFSAIGQHTSVKLSTTDLQDRHSLESAIQIAAFQQFDSHKTGRTYNVSVPSLGFGTFQAIRLRSGSLKRRGLKINEFTLPPGCQVSPIPERILLVYASIHNTSLYQDLPEGYAVVPPILSLFVYDASDLSSTQTFQPLSITATDRPITITFAESSAESKCAAFDDNSTLVDYYNFVQGDCQTKSLGTFAAVSNSSALAPAPAQSSTPSTGGAAKKHSNTWKIVVGSVLGGLALLILLTLLGVGIVKRRKQANLAKMEYQADQGETLQTTVIRNSRAPAAGETRTQPTLERDYAV